MSADTQEEIEKMSLEWLISYVFFFLVGSWIINWIWNIVDEFKETEHRIRMEKLRKDEDEY